MENQIFDNELYIEKSCKEILKRKQKYDGRIYLEVGGKLFDDYHASRVIPGFMPNNKIKIIERLKEKIDVILAISNYDIENEKIREDKGMDYKQETFFLIENFQKMNLDIKGVVINKYIPSKRIDFFISEIEKRGIKVYIQKEIENFPENIDYALSDKGFGKNEYIEVEKEIVLVTAPGPSSGKMFTCLAQMYHEANRKQKTAYFKFETFPVAEYSIHHPTNLAYESATADIGDEVLIDPFHLEAYGEVKTNYNRDIQNFTILKNIMNRITGENIYLSPTDMCINVLSECVLDEEKVKQASREEIVRRYYKAMYSYYYKNTSKKEMYKHANILRKAQIKPRDIDLIKIVLESKENTNRETLGIRLRDGRIVIGKTGKHITASAAAVLNALKTDTNILDETHLIPENVLSAILKLKKRHLKNVEEKLDAWDCIISTSILNKVDTDIDIAINNMDILKNTKAHSTYILSDSDKELFRNLGIDITYEI